MKRVGSPLPSVDQTCGEVNGGKHPPYDGQEAAKVSPEINSSTVGRETKSSVKSQTVILNSDRMASKKASTPKNKHKQLEKKLKHNNFKTAANTNAIKRAKKHKKHHREKDSNRVAKGTKKRTHKKI
jgi:hypothetical protein